MKLADNFYQSLIDRTSARHNVDSALAGKIGWEEWRAGVRGALLECLGGSPDTVALDIQRTQPVALNGYTRERIEFTSEEGLRTPAYLLMPNGANSQTPVALALPGHGIGVNAIVGLDAKGAPAEADYQKNFAISLCEKGFVVIAPELLGFGELRLARDDNEQHPSASSCHAISAMLLTVGRTMAGARVWQARRCLDVMEELGFHGPVVSMGISGGGLVCTYTTALDERIRACCISGFANTYRGSILAVYHCVDNYQPGMLCELELPDILASIAPRPMMWEAGESDPIFPLPAVLEANAIVRKAYAAHDAESDFSLDRFKGEHQVHGVAAYGFLARAAKLEQR